MNGNKLKIVQDGTKVNVTIDGIEVKQLTSVMQKASFPIITISFIPEELDIVAALEEGEPVDAWRTFDYKREDDKRWLTNH